MKILGFRASYYHSYLKKILKEVLKNDWIRKRIQEVGTKRPDFFYQFGCFKIKKLALTKENLKKVNGGTDKQGREIEPRNTWFYLIDTRKELTNNRVSGVFWENENIFFFDTYSGKNLNDYKLGFYKGTISSDKIKIQEITKQEFEEIKEYNLKELA